MMVMVRGIRWHRRVVSPMDRMVHVVVLARVLPTHPRRVMRPATRTRHGTAPGRRGRMVDDVYRRWAHGNPGRCRRERMWHGMMRMMRLRWLVLMLVRVVVRMRVSQRRRRVHKPSYVRWSIQHALQPVHVHLGGCLRLSLCLLVLLLLLLSMVMVVVEVQLSGE